MLRSPDPALAIQRTRNGRGLVAERKFKKNEPLFVIRGKLIPVQGLGMADKRTADNTIRFSERSYISPTNELGDFLNHSCHPTAFLQKRGRKLFVVALQSISANTEITIDYSTILANDERWTMRCNCGSVDCRAVVKKFVDLPGKLQKRYHSLRIVPPYINRTARKT